MRVGFLHHLFIGLIGIPVALWYSILNFFRGKKCHRRNVWAERGSLNYYIVALKASIK